MSDRDTSKSPPPAEPDEVHIPRAPGLPSIHDVSTQPPGPFVPPISTEPFAVQALRQLLEEHKIEVNGILRDIKAELTFEGLKEWLLVSFREEAAKLANPFLERDALREEQIKKLKEELDEFKTEMMGKILNHRRRIEELEKQRGVS